MPGRFVGRVFGSYEVKALIAAGGMGEVYRAVDTRLNRTVAIKTLPGATVERPGTPGALQARSAGSSPA